MIVGEIEGRFLLYIQELRERGRVSSCISVLCLGSNPCSASGIRLWKGTCVAVDRIRACGVGAKVLQSRWEGIALAVLFSESCQRDSGAVRNYKLDGRKLN